MIEADRHRAILSSSYRDPGAPTLSRQVSHENYTGGKSPYFKDFDEGVFSRGHQQQEGRRIDSIDSGPGKVGSLSSVGSDYDQKCEALERWWR